MKPVTGKDGGIVGYRYDPPVCGVEGCGCGDKKEDHDPLALAPIKQRPNIEMIADKIESGEYYKVHPSVPAPFRYPATTEELLEYAKAFFEECVGIAHQRNQRYAGSTDPFKNFKLGGDYGIAIRMTDKVSRLLTLTHPTNTIDGGGESIEDTCRDLANYAMLLSAMRKNERGVV